MRCCDHVTKPTDAPSTAARGLFAYLTLSQPICNLQDALASRLIRLVHSDTVAIRAKALKAVQEIALLDASFLKNATIFGMILKRLSDPSANVRDATLDLLSKVLLKPSGTMDADLIQTYYPLLSERVVVGL